MSGTYTIAYRKAQPGMAPAAEEIRRLRTAASAEECIAAGMGRWDESGLLLIPEAWVDAVPDDLLVESIMGRSLTIEQLRARGGGWDDVREGFLAWGWVPRKVEGS